MTHTIQTVLTVVIDGERQSWSATAETAVEPCEFAIDMSKGIRDAAVHDLFKAARNGFPTPEV